MTTYVPNTTTAESSETSSVADDAARERQGQWMAARRGPRRVALVFASGFMLGSVAATMASLVGGRRRMPFVLGNRNVFVSLPFSGISMTSPSVRVKGRGRGRRQRGVPMAVPMAIAMMRARQRGKQRGK